MKPRVLHHISAEVGGDVGYDGGKKIEGHKRHIVADTLGSVLFVAVTAAGPDDGTHAHRVLRHLTAEGFPRLRAVFADSEYRNRAPGDWMATTGARYRLVISTKPKDRAGFVPLKVRRVVGRTFAWLGRCRRLSRDYEYNTSASEG